MSETKDSKAEQPKVEGQLTHICGKNFGAILSPREREDVTNPVCDPASVPDYNPRNEVIECAKEATQYIKSKADQPSQFSGNPFDCLISEKRVTSGKAEQPTAGDDGYTSDFHQSRTATKWASDINVGELIAERESLPWQLRDKEEELQRLGTQVDQLTDKWNRTEAELAKVRQETIEECIETAVVTNWGEHDAMKCLVCGAEEYDHTRFKHTVNCKLAALRSKQTVEQEEPNNG